MKTNQTDVAIVVIMINLKIFRFLILLLITKLYIKCTLPSSSSEYEKRVKRYCDTIGLTLDQQHFCYMHSDIVKVFINGSQYGHKQCQKTFKFSNETGTRWNCTNLSNKTFLTIPKPKGELYICFFYFPMICIFTSVNDNKYVNFEINVSAKKNFLKFQISCILIFNRRFSSLYINVLVCVRAVGKKVRWVLRMGKGCVQNCNYAKVQTDAAITLESFYQHEHCLKFL